MNDTIKERPLPKIPDDDPWRNKNFQSNQ